MSKPKFLFSKHRSQRCNMICSTVEELLFFINFYNSRKSGKYPLSKDDCLDEFYKSECGIAIFFNFNTVNTRGRINNVSSQNFYTGVPLFFEDFTWSGFKNQKDSSSSEFDKSFFELISQESEG